MKPYHAISCPDNGILQHKRKFTYIRVELQHAGEPLELRHRVLLKLLLTIYLLINWQADSDRRRIR